MTDKPETVEDVLAEMRADTSSYPDRTYWANRIEAALERERAERNAKIEAIAGELENRPPMIQGVPDCCAYCGFDPLELAKRLRDLL